MRLKIVMLLLTVLVYGHFAETHAQTIRVPSRRKAIVAPGAAPALEVAAAASAAASIAASAAGAPADAATAAADAAHKAVLASSAAPLTTAAAAAQAASDAVRAAAISAGASSDAATAAANAARDAVNHALSPAPSGCHVFPTQHKCMDYGDGLDSNINAFFNTEKNFSFLDQMKSIYNGASNSATVSADIGSFNFSHGMQVTVGTNIQAGATTPTPVNSGTIPTLSATAAGQATQNMLYGGTIFASGLYPLLATGVTKSGSADGVGLLIDVIGREGIDLQNFKSGTSINVNSPSSHASAQIEGYLQYNSTALSAGSSNFGGAVFAGGSYGYSYTAHDYARDYGFGTNVNNGIGQASLGFLISGVAKLAVSRAFGPSQTYIDSTSKATMTTNNFKAWSFGISYQSPAPATK